MLKELFDLVKGSAQDSVINNSDVPNERNDEVVAEATNTVASGFRNIVAGGGLQSLLSLFGGSGQQGGSGLLGNPIVSMMIGHFSEKLMSKYNLNGSQATNVSNQLIPNVIGNLINKNKEQGGGGFLEGLLNSITGGRSAEVVQEQQSSGNGGLNLQDILGQLSGGAQNNGGGGLMDMVTKMAQGAQSQQQRNGGGGLMDLIKGFMK